MTDEELAMARRAIILRAINDHIGQMKVGIVALESIRKVAANIPETMLSEMVQSIDRRIGQTECRFVLELPKAVLGELAALDTTRTEDRT